MLFNFLTENSNKVLNLAQDEARLLGHNFIGSEQLLSALAAEENGIAGKTIRSLGVTVEDIRLEIEKIIGNGAGFSAVEIPFTPRAKRVLDLAKKEAELKNLDYVDTEHILLGILKEGNGVAVCILENLGIKLKLANLLGMKILEPETFDWQAQRPDDLLGLNVEKYNKTQFEQIEIPEFLKKDLYKEQKQDKNTNFLGSFFRKIKLMFRPEEEGISKKL